MAKSMLDIAFDYFNQRKDVVRFSEVWEHVKKELNLSDEEANKKIAKFYTNLSIDGRFVILSDDIWDLKANHSFDEVHRDMGEVYSIEDSDNGDDSDDEDTVIEDNDDNKEKDDEYLENDESSEKNSEENYY